jgi:hypothetical protein
VSAHREEGDQVGDADFVMEGSRGHGGQYGVEETAWQNGARATTRGGVSLMGQS